MSIQRMNDVWSEAPQAGSELLLLLAIADNANDEGVAWPSQATLAAKTRMSERTVQRLVKKLEQDEALAITVRQEQRKRRNVYTLTTRQIVVPSGGDDPTPEVATGRRSCDVGTVREPSEEPLAASPQKKMRKLDDVWEALVVVCGSPATRSETSDFAKTVNEIRPFVPAHSSRKKIESAIRARRTEFIRRYPDATFTHRVLRNRWNELRPARDTGGGVRYRELEDGEA